MKTHSNSVLFTLALMAIANISNAQGTAFTYQGRLSSGTTNASGVYDLTFTVFGQASGGSAIAGPITNSPTAVGSNGLFTVTLDFGAGVFTGASRWLEIGVRTNGIGSFSTLSPRQALTPTPYSLYASNSGSATTAISANGVAVNAVGTTGLQNGAVDSSKIADGTIASSDLSGALLSNTFWRLLGNGGTTAGVNFLGTTDNQPLELKANNARALRLEPTTNSPNFISGWTGNGVGAGGVGATIGGGGAPHAEFYLYFNDVNTNLVFNNQPNFVADADYATVAGGFGNVVTNSKAATVSGGFGNSIRGRNSGDTSAGPGSTISGGIQNTITGQDSDALCSTLGGGFANGIIGGYFSTIGGGFANTMITRPRGATIGGGSGNRLDSSYEATIAGGLSNIVNYLSSGATIGGGIRNVVETGPGFGAQRATISGGEGNFILSGLGNSIGGGINNNITGTTTDIGSDGRTISGGGTNRIDQFSDYAAISGGSQNTVSSNASFATIGGGTLNSIRFPQNGFSTGSTNSTISGGAGNILYTTDGVIGGGYSNRIGTTSSTFYESGHTVGGGRDNVINYQNSFSTIAGGVDNFVDGTTATIAGGWGNQIQWAGPSTGNSIGGGVGNSIQSDYSSIGGGASNRVTGEYSVIGGGENNLVTADHAIIPGGLQANASHHGQMAHASGQFAATGDAQTSVFVCRGTTANATPTDLFLDGGSQRLTIPVNSTWTFDILVTGRSSSGSSAGYQLRGVIKNTAGTTALVGSTDLFTLGEDVPAWTATAVADDANDALVIRVTGATSTTIRWVASARTAEVTY